MEWRDVGMIEPDAQAVRASLSRRAPAHVVRDRSISTWSQAGPKQYRGSDLAVDLGTGAGFVRVCIFAGRSIEGGTPRSGTALVRRVGTTGFEPATP